MINYDTTDSIWEGLDVCEVHVFGSEVPVNAELSCEGCATEREQRMKILTSIAQGVQDRFKALAEMGNPVPPSLPVDCKVDVLAEMLLQDYRSRAIYEGEVMRRLTNAARRTQEAMKTPTLHVAKTMPANLKSV